MSASELRSLHLLFSASCDPVIVHKVSFDIRAFAERERERERERSRGVPTPNPDAYIQYTCRRIDAV